MFSQLSDCNGGGKKMGEEKGVGGGGCGRKRNPRLLNVTLGRTAGKIMRGWGRLDG